MKKPPQSKGLFLFCAIFFTAVCLMYAVAVLTKGIYVVLAVPSPVANIAFFSASLTLAALCWYCWLRYKPDRTTFYQKEHRPSTCWAMAAGCFVLELLFLAMFFALERNRVLLFLGVLLQIFAIVWVRRALAAGKRRDCPSGDRKEGGS